MRWENQSESSQLQKFKTHLKQVKHWVATTSLTVFNDTKEICYDYEAQAKIIDHWIEIMAELLKIKNYNGCMEILNGLIMLEEVKEVWNYVTKSYREIYNNIKELQDNNFEGYRRLLDEVQESCIPYIRVLLKDLEQIEVIETISSDQNVINYQKLRKIVDVIDKIQNFLSFAYNIKVDKPIQVFLKQMNPLNKKNC